MLLSLTVILAIKSIELYGQGKDRDIENRLTLIKEQFAIINDRYSDKIPRLTGSAAIFFLLCNKKEERDMHFPADTDFVLTSRALDPIESIGNYTNVSNQHRTSLSLVNDDGIEIDIIRSPYKQSYIKVGGINVIDPKELVSLYQFPLEDRSGKEPDDQKKISALYRLIPQYADLKRYIASGSKGKRSLIYAASRYAPTKKTARRLSF